jgi:hypothetical protein
MHTPDAPKCSGQPGERWWKRAHTVLRAHMKAMVLLFIQQGMKKAHVPVSAENLYRRPPLTQSIDMDSPCRALCALTRRGLQTKPLLRVGRCCTRTRTRAHTHTHTHTHTHNRARKPLDWGAMQPEDRPQAALRARVGALMRSTKELGGDNSERRQARWVFELRQNSCMERMQPPINAAHTCAGCT